MIKIITRTLLGLIVVSGFLLFQGCTKNSLGTTSVTGTVTLDGKPIDGVNVSFSPKNPDGRQCYGVTDAGGVYSLTVPGADVGSGAIPGDYTVTLSKEQSPAEGLSDEEIQQKFGGSLPSPVNHLPQKYADKGKTDIAPVTVEKGKKNVFNFDLTSQ